MALSKRDRLRKSTLIKKHRLQGANKSKRTPDLPAKSHIVLAHKVKW